MSIEATQLGVLEAASGNSDVWNAYTHELLGSNRSPEEGLNHYIDLSGLKVPSGQKGNRVEGLLKKSVKYLATTPSLELIQKVLPHLTEEKGNGPMNNLLHGMVEYPLDLVSGEIKKEPYPSLERVTQAALDLALPLCGALGVNMQNPDGVALGRALSLAPQIHDLTDLLYRLRNKHAEPTKSALAGCWMIIEEAMQCFGTAESLSKRNMPRFDKTARFPNKDTSQSDMETQWLELESIIRVALDQLDVKGIVLKIQHKDTLTKTLLDIYTRLKIQELQNLLDQRELPRVKVSAISLTPDASLLIANPQFDDGFNPSAQKEWVQKTTIAAVKETREHISQGKLEQLKVSAEQFANIMEFGIRDLDKEASVRLEETKNAISSSLCALTSEGDLVQFGPDEGSGLFNLGIDQVIFHPHEGGAVAQVTVLGTTIDIVFDQSHHLQTIGDYDRSYFPISTICKIEATVLEYVREIRSDNEVVGRNDMSEDDGVNSEEEEGGLPQEGSHVKRRRAHLRVLPIHHQSDVYPKHPPLKNKAEREKEHQERAQRMNKRVMESWGISLLELNTLFFIAQGDKYHLSGKSKSVLLEGEPLPTGVVELVGSLAKRAHARLTNSDGTLYSVTFVHEGGVEENAMPRVNVCKNAATLISSHFTGV